MKDLLIRIDQLLSLLILTETLHKNGNSLNKNDNENYYQLCTISLLIAIDSHYHIDSEVFLYIVFSNINLIELLKISF